MPFAHIRCTVLAALKVLAGKVDQCRYCMCNRGLGGRKKDMLIQGSKVRHISP